jgi:prepilin peptidase CpaA
MVPVLVVVVATAIAAVTDIWKFRVYNALTIPLLAAGLIYHAWVGGLPGLWASLAGAGFGFGILILFYATGGVGAGDVKLLAAVGAWLGLKLTYYVFIASGLAAGVYAAGLIVYYGKVGETMIKLAIAWHKLTALGRHLLPEERLEDELARTDRRRRLIPFAAMMSFGFIATLLWFWNGRGLDWPPYGNRPARSARATPRAVVAPKSDAGPSAAQSPAAEASSSRRIEPLVTQLDPRGGNL